jgi:isopentenyldiphosphate isomerase
MKNLSSDEWFPVVDENGNQISLALRSVCHDGKSKFLHPVVHLHLISENRKIFLQKRAMTKDLLPGYWDTSVGGHLSPGESVEEALTREALEELGLQKFEYRFIKKYIWESTRERELVYSYTGSSNNDPAINTEEIEAGRFWSWEEIRKNLGRNIFTPNFEHEFKMLLTDFSAVKYENR